MWLLLLGRLLVVYQPVSLALSLSNALRSLSVRGFPLVVGIAVRVVVAGFGVAAGTALTNRRPGAVALAKLALALSAACDVFVYTTSYVPNNLIPGDAPFYVAGSLVYHAGWLVYLFFSKDVRSRYQD
jgi:hypothetical protein